MRMVSKGFTIIELLIVIVVIGILAAITLVTYNGAQDRAEFARATNDIQQINDALKVYHSQNGSYPPSSGGTWESQYSPGGTTPDANFLSALVPSYLDKMPAGKANPSYYWYSYFYIAYGADYKLLRCTYKTASLNSGLPDVEKNSSLADPTRPDACWGYWSDGAKTW